jgi:hypothetical protein
MWREAELGGRRRSRERETREGASIAPHALFSRRASSRLAIFLAGLGLTVQLAAAAHASASSSLDGLGRRPLDRRTSPLLTARPTGPALHFGLHNVQYSCLFKQASFRKCLLHSG